MPLQGREVREEVFRVAVPSRREQEPSLFTVIAWRDQAEHAAESPVEGQPAGWREDLVVPDRLSVKPSVGLAALTILTLVSPG
jgi:hypothetical protein